VICFAVGVLAPCHALTISGVQHGDEQRIQIPIQKPPNLADLRAAVRIRKRPRLTKTHVGGAGYRRLVQRVPLIAECVSQRHR
jgi:hypothetical protein